MTAERALEILAAMDPDPRVEFTAEEHRAANVLTDLLRRGLLDPRTVQLAAAIALRVVLRGDGEPS